MTAQAKPIRWHKLATACRKAASFAVLLVVMLWLGGWVRGQMMAPTSQQLPPFSLPVLSQTGAESQLVQVERGRPQLLYLFAPWCQICRFTFPHIESWQSQGRTVTPIALDYQSMAEVQAFIKQSGTNVEVLLGDNELSRYLDVVAFPTYLIVNAEGEIVSKRVGYLPEWVLSLYLSFYQI